MLLTYVDESYSRSRYFVVGLAVHHESIRSLEDALHQVVSDATSNLTGVDPGAELHGHPLFHGKDAWHGVPPRRRIGVYNAAFACIAEHDVRIFLRGVHIPKLHVRYKRPHDPHDICLQHLLERVNTYAESTDQVALVIADELHEHDRHRRDLRDYKNVGTPGYLSSRLPRIVDTIHFAPSHHSRLIQAADLVAFLHHRRQTNPREGDPRAARANAALWSRLVPQIEHEQTWHP